MLPHQTELTHAKRRRTQSELSDDASTAAAERAKLYTCCMHTFDVKLYVCYFCEEQASVHHLGPFAMLQHSNLTEKFALVLPICRMITC